MNKFGKVSLFTAGIMYPAAALVGGLVAWNLKSGNRDNVDITAGLAYLRPILVTGFVLFGVLFATSLVSGVLALKKDQDKSIGKLALILLATIVIVSGGAAFANAKTDNAIDQYRTQKDQQFFDAARKLEESK